MTEKGIVNQLRTLAQNPAIDATDRIELDHIADKYDLPRPKPGTVVWWRYIRFCADFAIGVVAAHGDGVIDSEPEFHEWRHIEYKPARIAGPLQEIVDIPPMSEWPDGGEALCMYIGSDPGPVVWRIITRAEAARREEGL